MELSEAYIYRIFHIDNLEYILNLGKLTTYNSVDKDLNYKGIGESDLIGLRADHQIVTSYTNNTYCPSCQYLPFYFAPRSVMLYRIITGYNVPQIEQDKLITVIFKLSEIIEKIDFLFTDGHGYAKMSQWFDDIQYLHLLDTDAIKATQWKNTLEDSDFQRRKQAEFWIKEQISLEYITGIGVYNEENRIFVNDLCQKYNSKITVKVKPNYYY